MAIECECYGGPLDGAQRAVPDNAPWGCVMLFRSIERDDETGRLVAETVTRYRYEDGKLLHLPPAPT